MKYITQYTNRKKQRILKKLEASSEVAVRDFIRREGARDIIISARSNAHLCPKCRRLTDDGDITELCEKCQKEGGSL